MIGRLRELGDRVRPIAGGRPYLGIQTFTIPEAGPDNQPPPDSFELRMHRVKVPSTAEPGKETMQTVYEVL